MKLINIQPLLGNHKGSKPERMSLYGNTHGSHRYQNSECQNRAVNANKQNFKQTRVHSTKQQGHLHGSNLMNYDKKIILGRFSSATPYWLRFLLRACHRVIVKTVKGKMTAGVIQEKRKYISSRFGRLRMFATCQSQKMH